MSSPAAEEGARLIASFKNTCGRDSSFTTDAVPKYYCYIYRGGSAADRVVQEHICGRDSVDAHGRRELPPPRVRDDNRRY